MHLRGNVIYNTWENFWKKAYKSSYFRAQYDETSERTDWSLSERQLFTQSNGRTLLGQDTMGRLHFLCTPHDKIYAVPSGGTDLGGQFKGYIGQYYQNDTALLLGKMKYDLELDNGLMISGANKQSWTTYYDDFLPVTATEHPELETRIFSFAPILEKEAVPASSIHPVPGPAGAFYCIEVKNTSGCKIKGKLRLSFDQKFVNQFEHYGKYFDDYTVTPYKSEWDQKLLVLWHPEACAAIQLLDSVCEGQGDNPRIYVPFELKANESRTFTTVCMVGEVPQNTHKVAGFYISLPDELAGGEKSVMLSEHPFPQDTQHKMKQVTLYVEGQKTQAAGVIRASLETDGKQCKVSEIPVLILSKEDYADALDKMYHGTKK